MSLTKLSISKFLLLNFLVGGLFSSRKMKSKNTQGMGIQKWNLFIKNTTVDYFLKRTFWLVDVLCTKKRCQRRPVFSCHWNLFDPITFSFIKSYIKTWVLRVQDVFKFAKIPSTGMVREDGSYRTIRVSCIVSMGTNVSMYP